MPSPDTSQRRYLRLFSRYVDIDTEQVLHKRFERDLRELRESGVVFADSKAMIRGEKVASSLSEFMLKYRLPYAMIDFVYAYISEDKIDPLLIQSGMFLVSEADRTAIGLGRDSHVNFSLYEQLRNRNGKRPRSELKLVIPAGVTLNEAKAFLDSHWISYVQPRMKRYTTSVSATRSRIRSRTSEIDRRILELKTEGLTHAEVARLINSEFRTTYNPNNIGVRLHRIRQSE